MNHSDDLLQSHRRTWELIPWVVNARASVEDKRIVDEHLANCGNCRDEFAFQSQLHRAMKSDDGVAVDPQPALQRLWSRIDRQEVSPGDFASPRARAQANQRIGIGPLGRGLLAAVIVEAIGLTALCGALLTRSGIPSAPYRTLTAQAEIIPRATIRVVLAPAMTVAELQALLTQTQLQIVAGPSEAGVYSLAPLSMQAGTDSERELARLRAHPGVRFAEPITAVPVAASP